MFSDILLPVRVRIWMRIRMGLLRPRIRIRMTVQIRITIAKYFNATYVFSASDLEESFNWRGEDSLPQLRTGEGQDALHRPG